MAVLQNLAQAAALIAALEAKLAAANAPRALTLKVSVKGALSLYGMGRFPVTLYREQWERVLTAAPEIRAFIKANDAMLKTKAQAGDAD